MRAYIVRRLLILIPTMFLLTMLIFFLVVLMPGDIVDAMLAKPGAGPYLDRAVMEKQLGLDASLPVQYARWMGFLPQSDGGFDGIFQGNLGRSFTMRVTVNKLAALKLPVTLELGFMGLVIAQLIALPVGIYSAVRQDKWGDYVGRSIAILAISIPGFWLATMVIIFPALWWDYMPPIMLIRFTDDPIGNLRMFIIPAAILGMALAGGTMRMTRTMMLEVLRQDYIRTAWAKGLKERVVVLRHAVKNALIPVVTILGLQIPVMIGGTVIIEQIFLLPGMGRLIIEAVIDRDEQLISGVVLIYAVVIVLVNLITDLTYAYLDPRIRYK